MKDNKVGLARNETRLDEIEYINKYSNYSYEQKMELFNILDILDQLDQFEKVVKRIEEINFDNGLAYDSKQKLLHDLKEIYTNLEIKYKNKRAEFDGEKKKMTK